MSYLAHCVIMKVMIFHCRYTAEIFLSHWKKKNNLVEQKKYDPGSHGVVPHGTEKNADKIF